MTVDIQRSHTDVKPRSNQGNKGQLKGASGTNCIRKAALVNVAPREFAERIHVENPPARRKKSNHHRASLTFCVPDFNDYVRIHFWKTSTAVLACINQTTRKLGQLPKQFSPDSLHTVLLIRYFERNVHLFVVQKRSQLDTLIDEVLEHLSNLYVMK